MQIYIVHVLSLILTKFHETLCSGLREFALKKGKRQKNGQKQFIAITCQ